MTEEPSCIVDCKALLGEGPIWIEAEQALYWLDIKGCRIFRLGEGDEVESWKTPFRIGSLAPRHSGGFIAGTEKGIAAVAPREGRFEILLDPEAERPGNRFNDGKVDRQGRFWAGSMDDAEEQASGALYRIDPNLGWERVDDAYKVTNGPAFSPNGRTMYHNDSARQLVYAFDLGSGGHLSNRRTFAKFEAGEGYPDGMTVDAEGCLWIAFWDGWCIRRLSPRGERLQRIDMPVQRPTSCAFGGASLESLYVTSARAGIPDKALGSQPHAGGLFRLSTDVPGVPEEPFRS
jgi:xylono-1,5-lactonase